MNADGSKIVYPDGKTSVSQSVDRPLPERQPALRDTINAAKTPEISSETPSVTPSLTPDIPVVSTATNDLPVYPKDVWQYHNTKPYSPSKSNTERSAEDFARSLKSGHDHIGETARAIDSAIYRGTKTTIDVGEEMYRDPGKALNTASDFYGIDKAIKSVDSTIYRGTKKALEFASDVSGTTVEMVKDPGKALNKATDFYGIDKAIKFIDSLIYRGTKKVINMVENPMEDETLGLKSKIEKTKILWKDANDVYDNTVNYLSDADRVAADEKKYLFDPALNELKRVPDFFFDRDFIRDRAKG
jgi:hypothetical protein